MDTNTILLAMIAVDNRIVETIKRLLMTQFVNDDLAGVVVLLVSFIVGSIEAALLPAVALFSNYGATPLADIILTGVVIGAGANGLDILGKGWGALVNRVGAPAAPVVTTSTPVTQGSETKVDVSTSAVHPVG